MTLAFWCVLVAGLQHIPFTALAKLQHGLTRFDNNSPREYLAARTGLYKRADWVQQNSFEAFPLFAASVIIAHLTQAPQANIDILAVAFVVLRIVYGLLYLLDWAWTRTAVWYAALGCCVAMFFV